MSPRCLRYIDCRIKLVQFVQACGDPKVHVISSFGKSHFLVIWGCIGIRRIQLSSSWPTVSIHRLHVYPMTNTHMFSGSTYELNILRDLYVSSPRDRSRAIDDLLVALGRVEEIIAEFSSVPKAWRVVLWYVLIGIHCHICIHSTRLSGPAFILRGLNRGFTILPSALNRSKATNPTTQLNPDIGILGTSTPSSTILSASVRLTAI